MGFSCNGRAYGSGERSRSESIAVFQMMRILHCIPNMAGGGAERQLVYLSGELVRRGWDVHVALLKDGPNFEELVSAGITIHKIAAWGNHDVSILWRLMKLIRTMRPHLVQTWITQMDVFGGIASRLAGTPFILSERSSAAAYPPSLKNRLRVCVGRCAEAIVANSRGGKKYWQMQIKDSVPKYVIHNALPVGDIAMVSPTMDDVRLPSTSKVVLFAGRFSQVKNIESLIRAFKMVESQLDAVLLLCGEGELRPRVAKMIRDENLDGRVILGGYVKNLWGLMKRADVFISVSTYEGHPNAVLEAMACGCPLVLSDIPAHRALLEGDQAFFVELERPSEIAHAILTCIDRPEVAQRMAKKAKARASSFSVQAVTDQYESVYNQILSHSIQERR